MGDSRLYHWAAPLLCFYLAFSGLLRASVPCSAPLPWYFFAAQKTLHDGPARLVGLLSLGCGLLALSHPLWGLVALYATAWLSWLLGLSQRAA